jgi:hypothetical protein
MPVFEFEIQSCIRVTMEGTDKEDARIKIIDNLSSFASEMLNQDTYVSDGKEVEKEVE